MICKKGNNACRFKKSTQVSLGTSTFMSEERPQKMHRSRNANAARRTTRSRILPRLHGTV